MKTSTKVAMGIALSTAVAMTMYFMNNKEAFAKVKKMASKMMNKNMNMDLDALYNEM